MVSDVQAVRFDKRWGWTTKEANKWLKHHKFKPIKKVDLTTPNWLRYRLVEPDEFKRMITHRIPGEGINLIIGFY